jgi:hypothetical protein
MAPFFAERSRLRLDPEARNAQHTYFEPGGPPSTLLIQQMLIDPEEINDWSADFFVDVHASRETGTPSLWLRSLGPLTPTHQN